MPNCYRWDQQRLCRTTSASNVRWAYGLLSCRYHNGSGSPWQAAARTAPMGGIASRCCAGSEHCNCLIPVNFGIPWAKPVQFYGWPALFRGNSHPQNDQNSTRLIPNLQESHRRNYRREYDQVEFVTLP